MLRGGGWNITAPDQMTSGFRAFSYNLHEDMPVYIFHHVGFRIVCRP
jgi:hypothetical protein